MSMLISGTTPTITFTFNEVDVSDISVAYLVIKVYGQTIIEKDITEAQADESTLSWTLTQAETLLLKPGATCRIGCDWKTSEGVRGRSVIGEYKIEASGKLCEI